MKSFYLQLFISLGSKSRSEFSSDPDFFRIGWTRIHATGTRIASQAVLRARFLNSTAEAKTLENECTVQEVLTHYI